jgi:hypothetical protein
MEPFFAALGFELELQKTGETIAGRNYAISHRDPKRAGLPVHIAGCGTNLDSKPNRGGLSPHALVQEYECREVFLFCDVARIGWLRLETIYRSLNTR